MDLVTPHTPAAVLGHVDAAPRTSSVRACGWKASDIARILLGRFSFGSPEPGFRLLDCYSWALRVREALSGFAPHGGNYGRTYGCAETDEIIDHLNVAEKLAEDALLRELELMEAAGVLAVSVSAYNADEDCAVVYYDGKPIGVM